MAAGRLHQAALELERAPSRANRGKRSSLTRGCSKIDRSHQGERDPARRGFLARLSWSGELLWAWGAGEISGPHDATTLGNGNLLIFDNGLVRGWSRVIEVDPISRATVWEYWVPSRDPRARRSTIVRLYRYPSELIERLLEAAGGQTH